MPFIERRKKRASKRLGVPVKKLPKSTGEGRPYAKKFCDTCRFWGHTSYNCPRRKEFEGKCGICASAGHQWEKCSKKGMEAALKNCSHCGVLGHNHQQCNFKDLDAKAALAAGRPLQRRQNRAVAKLLKKRHREEAENVAGAAGEMPPAKRQRRAAETTQSAKDPAGNLPKLNVKKSGSPTATHVGPATGN
eukprot:TRINITY_DN1767_c0_g1_i2.p1 TRINITY_DN1767_c0_g1~~TRINITY_DN1767_c0_g1_i2.p1  ORF type:complete len:202 (-),score=48.66 TRINITY_DN1767_c0_g1_i2:185-757(-)